MYIVQKLNLWHKYLKSYGHFSYIQSQEMAAILDFKACNWQITPKALAMDSLYQWT